MHPAVKKPKDLIAGMLFVILGIVVVYVASAYDFGTARQMGPGYFPVVLGGLLCFLGALTMVQGFFGQAEQIEPLTFEHLRSVFLVLLGTVLFGLLIRAAGLPLSVVIMVLLGTMAMRGYGWRAAILTALALAIGSVIIFVQLLGQPLPIIGELFRF